MPWRVQHFASLHIVASPTTFIVMGDQERGSPRGVAGKFGKKGEPKAAPAEGFGMGDYVEGIEMIPWDKIRVEIKLQKGQVRPSQQEQRGDPP